MFRSLGKRLQHLSEWFRGEAGAASHVQLHQLRVLGQMAEGEEHFTRRLLECQQIVSVKVIDEGHNMTPVEI